MNDAAPTLETALAPHGFRRLPSKSGSVCSALWKRQTLNTNRAVALIEVAAVPDDLSPLLKQVKTEAAFRCGFFPFFYGIGTQVALSVTGSQPEKRELSAHIDKIDNQWSLIQSLFIVHGETGLVCSARTWGQVITGKYQDAIAAAFAQSSVRQP